jgi:hypothetical protein
MYIANGRDDVVVDGTPIAVLLVRHTKNEDHKTCENKDCAFGSRRRGSRDVVIHDGEVTENPTLGVSSFLAT